MLSIFLRYEWYGWYEEARNGEGFYKWGQIRQEKRSVKNHTHQCRQIALWKFIRTLVWSCVFYEGVLPPSCIGLRMISNWSISKQHLADGPVWDQFWYALVFSPTMWAFSRLPAPTGILSCWWFQLYNEEKAPGRNSTSERWNVAEHSGRHADPSRGSTHVYTNSCQDFRYFDPENETLSSFLSDKLVCPLYI